MKLFSVLILFFSFSLHAQEPQVPPHMMPGVETGTIEGMIKKENQPVANQTVALLVFHGEEMVLRLHKQTDAQGSFEFKNIFKDPEYTYLVGTQDQGSFFVLPQLQLQKGENSKHVELIIGENSPYKVDNAMLSGNNTPTSSPQEKAPASSDMAPMQPQSRSALASSSWWETPHQKIAIVLSLLVIVSALYYWIKPDASSSKS